MQHDPDGGSTRAPARGPPLCLPLEGPAGDDPAARRTARSPQPWRCCYVCVPLVGRRCGPRPLLSRVDRSPRSTRNLPPRNGDQGWTELVDARPASIPRQDPHSRLGARPRRRWYPRSETNQPDRRRATAAPAQKARYIYDKWRRARLACLVYFAALSLDGGCHSLCRLQDHPHYRRIETEVLDRERRYTVYAEELYYITVLVGANREEDDDTNDEGNEDNPLNQNLNLNTDTYQLSCTVARLVNDTKVLDQRDRNTCYRLLALYLGFRDPPQHDDIVVVDMVAAEWVELSERLRLDSVSNSIGRSVSGA